MDSKTTIKTLNKLIETCKDGEYGFRSCADYAQASDLHDLFSKRANECRGAGLELQTLVIRLGGKAEDEGTVAGALHRGWVAIRAELSSYTDQALLSECERGEDTAMDRYREALAEDELLPEARQIIDRQYLGVKQNHQQIRRLRDEARLHA